MIDLAKRTDEELLAASDARPEAFGVFYERHAPTILAFFMRRTGRREIALDLTAEVFAAALESSSRYKPEKGLAIHWLFGITRNKYAEHCRGQARASDARRRLGMPHRQFSDEELERAEEVIDASMSGYAERLDELAPLERDAVTGRVLLDQDYEALAAAAGTSSSTIRKRVSRGLAKLAFSKEKGA